MIYVASPYTHPDADVRHERYLLVRDYTADLLKAKVNAYSPIVHCHDMSIECGLPFTADFWENYNFDMIRRCDGLIVLTLDGWEKSVGIKGEMACAGEERIPVFMLPPGDISTAVRLYATLQRRHKS